MYHMAIQMYNSLRLGVDPKDCQLWQPGFEQIRSGKVLQTVSGRVKEWDDDKLLELVQPYSSTFNTNPIILFSERMFVNILNVLFLAVTSCLFRFNYSRKDGRT